MCPTVHCACCIKKLDAYFERARFVKQNFLKKFPPPRLFRIYFIISTRRWNEHDFRLRQEVGGTISSPSTLLEFFWHGANFRILNQHHRKRREPKFHGSSKTGSRLILINPGTFWMTYVELLNNSTWVIQKVPGLFLWKLQIN